MDNYFELHHEGVVHFDNCDMTTRCSTTGEKPSMATRFIGFLIGNVSAINLYEKVYVDHKGDEHAIPHHLIDFYIKWTSNFKKANNRRTSGLILLFPDSSHIHYSWFISRSQYKHCREVVEIYYT